MHGSMRGGWQGPQAEPVAYSTLRHPTKFPEPRGMPTNTSSLARVNGIDLGYQVSGNGEPLILLHGGFGSVEMFGPNLSGW